MIDPNMKKMSPWVKYSSLGTQLIIGLIILLYLGKKLDHFFDFKSIFVWILPFLYILFTLYKIIKDTKPGTDV
jgi:hypothetical protein